MATRVADIAQLPPNTPVIAGIGFAEDRNDDPTQSPEAAALMIAAVRGAAADAGSNALLPQLESISVTQGLWHYKNAGRLIGEALGCTSAKSLVSDLGVLQLTLLSDLCRAIAAGERSLGVVAGGEAKYRDLRATITQQRVSETFQPEETPPPDVRMTSDDPFFADVESRRGFSSATEFFAVIDSVLRRREGLTIDAHRDELARLYSEFSEIAARNPHAWRREPLPPGAIREAGPKNAMQAFPYTKLHCSQWNVNQAVAILVCSVAKARKLGLDESRWIFPLSGAESKHVVVLSRQRDLASHRGTVVAGERALALANVSRSEIGAAELYSCFPAAIRSFAKDLQLEGQCALTVTGAMAFGGGPFNHASLAGVARMVEVLRSDGGGAAAKPRRVGLVSNLSGIFGKQGCAVFSNVPNAEGYRFEDVTAEVAAVDQPLPLREDYAGEAEVVGYTVVFAGGRPSYAVAICDTPAGERTVVRSEDEALLTRMMREEFCGRTIVVRVGGSFSAE